MVVFVDGESNCGVLVWFWVAFDLGDVVVLCMWLKKMT